MSIPERDFWYSDPDEGNGEACFFWDGQRCHYEPLVIGIGGPCADCPDEADAIATLGREQP